MADEVCNGPCNSRWRDAQNAYQLAMTRYDPLDSSQERPQKPEIQPAYGNPWCGRCQAVIAAQLAELDDLVPLRMAVGDGYSADTSPQQSRGRSDPPSPSPAGDDQDDTYRMVKGWEDAYRDHLGVRPASRRGSLAQQRTLCIDWLSEHLSDILASPMAGDFGREIMEWHRALKNVAKAGVRRLQKPMRCPKCGLLMLTWVEGDEDVICHGCGLIMKWREYETEVSRAAEAIRRGENIEIAS